MRPHFRMSEKSLPYTSFPQQVDAIIILILVGRNHFEFSPFLFVYLLYIHLTHFNQPEKPENGNRDGRHRKYFCCHIYIFYDNKAIEETNHYKDFQADQGIKNIMHFVENHQYPAGLNTRQKLAHSRKYGQNSGFVF